MRIDMEQNSSLVDTVINIETQRFIERDLFNLTHIGERQPQPHEMPYYVGACRERVQRHLEQSN